VARGFNGSTEKITLGLGACGIAFGPMTIAAVVRNLDAGHDANIINSGGTTGTTRWNLGMVTGSGLIKTFNGTSTQNSTTAAATPNEWTLIAVTKASGTVAPRYHAYRYITGTWIHEDGAALADSTAAVSPILLASYAASGSEFKGDMLMGGVWNVVMTDSQIESLGSTFDYLLWSTAAGVAPKALWQLNQDVTTSVLDLTGNGADQTAIAGTVVTGDPKLGFSVVSGAYTAFPPKIPMGG
jgi:hypothetical protein